MEMKVIMRNLWNSVDRENVAFWSQMREFKEQGLDDLILLSIELNRNWLDAFEEEF